MKEMGQPTTKEIIFNAAKEEFFEYGYNNGTLKNISLRANVPQSLITYHFKTKDNLVSEIFKDFFNKISSLIDSYPELNITNSLYKKIVLTHIYYEIILNNDNNKRFYMEVKQSNSSNYKLIHEVSDVFFLKYIDDFKLSISKFEFEIMTIMNSAARRDFFLHYYEKNLNLTVAEIVEIVESIIPKFFRIDQNIINTYLLQGHRIVKDIDYSDIKFLV